MPDATEPAGAGTAHGRIGRVIRPWMPAAAVAAVYIAATVCLLPLGEVFQVNPDEGVNLVKATLVRSGHALYREIWSDQPPLFTYALVGWLEVTGWSVAAARMLVAIFAGILLFAVYDIARRSAGTAAALASAALLVVSTPFVNLGMSVMIGLPAVTLAVLAYWLALCGLARPMRRRWLAASAVSFAAALATKLFTLPVVPAIIAAIVIGPSAPPRSRREIAGDAALWFGVMAATLAVFLLPFGMPLVIQSAVHLEARNRFAGLPVPWSVFRPNRELLLLGMLGAAVLLRRRGSGSRHRSAVVFAPIALWLALALTALIQHRPLWLHQTILATVPASLLGGTALATLFTDLRERRWAGRSLAAASLVLVTALTYGQILGRTGIGRFLRIEVPAMRAAVPRQRAMVEQMQAVASTSTVVVVDWPMLAFASGSRLIPEIAVVTAKRRWTGHLSEARLAEVLRRVHPDHLVFAGADRGRFGSQSVAKVLAALDAPYEPVTPLTPASIDAAAPGCINGLWCYTDLASRARYALRAATAHCRSLATAGGYAWRYAEDGTARAGEQPLTAAQVAVSPPGTPAVGSAFLRAYASTGDPVHLEAARDVGRALVGGQLESGGWAAVIELDPERRQSWRYRRAPAGDSGSRNRSSYDDDTTQAALRFLLALDRVNRRAGVPDASAAAVRDALDYGLTKLLEAQYPNGAWPQQYDGDGATRHAGDHPILTATIPSRIPAYSAQPYRALYTLNDGAHTGLMHVLLDAYEALHERRYLDAAVHGGDFLLRAQLPPPQAGWAEQYDRAMAPAWARAFEPPAVSARETVRAGQALLRLAAITGTAAYRDAVGAALEWLARSKVAPDRWARFYALGTNRPIFGDRDGRIHFAITQISAERRVGYQWYGEFGVTALAAAARDEGEALTRVAATGKGAPSDDEVRAVLAGLDERGRWLSPGPAFADSEQTAEAPPTADPPRSIDMALFAEHVSVLSRYLDAQNPSRPGNPRAPDAAAHSPVGDRS